MNFPLESVAELPEEHKQAFLAALEHMQVKDSLRLYNGIVELCFTDCVDDFRSKNLAASEEKCVQTCCQKYLNLSARVGIRFQELFTQLEQDAQAKLTQQTKSAKK